RRIRALALRATRCRCHRWPRRLDTGARKGRRAMSSDWEAQCDAFIWQFAERAAHWHDHPGDLEASGSSDRLDDTLYHAANGKHVFPCNPLTRAPLTDHGFKDATTNPDQIRTWWMRWPDALIGFWPGPSDIAVLDIDMKNGKNGLAEFYRLTG